MTASGPDVCFCYSRTVHACMHLQALFRLYADMRVVRGVQGVAGPFGFVLTATSFYAEQGGQVGDQGVLERSSGGPTASISDAQVPYMHDSYLLILLLSLSLSSFSDYYYMCFNLGDR